MKRILLLILTMISLVSANPHLRTDFGWIGLFSTNNKFSIEADNTATTLLISSERLTSNRIKLISQNGDTQILEMIGNGEINHGKYVYATIAVSTLVDFLKRSNVVSVYNNGVLLGKVNCTGWTRAWNTLMEQY